MDDFWLTHGKLVTPRGIIDGSVRIIRGRIAAIRRAAPPGARTINVRGAYVAPGFIDLHVWGEPEVVSQDAARGGATGFLTTLGPESPAQLLRHVAQRAAARGLSGAECLGLHLEGPFLNPVRGGVLPARAMRPASHRELSQLWRASGGRLRMLTLAPERPQGLAAVAWCRAHRVVASLGHSDATYAQAECAVANGASAVTHVFNGMRPLHHRAPSLLEAALTDPRLTTMVIADGVHVSASALRLLVRAKGSAGIALVTDSIAHQGWDVVRRRGAYYTKRGMLAGSSLTMMEAVRNAVRFGNLSVAEAVRMASEIPARLLDDRTRGELAVGKRADLVVFDGTFTVRATIVGGRLAYHQGNRQKG